MNAVPHYLLFNLGAVHKGRPQIFGHSRPCPQTSAEPDPPRTSVLKKMKFWLTTKDRKVSKIKYVSKEHILSFNGEMAQVVELLV